MELQHAREMDSLKAEHEEQMDNLRHKLEAQLQAERELMAQQAANLQVKIRNFDYLKSRSQQTKNSRVSFQRFRARKRLV